MVDAEVEKNITNNQVLVELAWLLKRMVAKW